MHLDPMFLGKLIQLQQLLDKRAGASKRGDMKEWHRIDEDVQAAASSLGHFAVGYFGSEIREHLAAHQVVSA